MRHHAPPPLPYPANLPPPAPPHDHRALPCRPATATRRCGRGRPELGEKQPCISTTTTRRTLIAGAAGVAGLAALGSRAAHAAAPPALPSSPVALNVIDVAGQLQLTQARHGGLRQGQPQAGVADRLLAGAGAGTARQDQGAAGRRTGGHRPRADRHRRPVRRHRPEAVDPAGHRLRRRAAQPAGHLPAGRLEDAGPGAEPGGVRGVLPGRPDHRIHARRGEAAAENRAGTAGLGQGASRSASSTRDRPTPARAAPSCRACPTS